MPFRPIIFILVLLSVLAITPPARTDRDVVFSMERYKWSGKYYRDPSGKYPREQTISVVSNSHIYRMNPDGSRLKQITFGDRVEFAPQWSPDGNKIAFFTGDSYGQSRSELVFTDVWGRSRHKICKVLEQSTNLKYSWSPDSKWIFILSKVDMSPKNDLAVINVKTGETFATNRVSDCSWSPDGNRIVIWFLELQKPTVVREARIWYPFEHRSVAVPYDIFTPTWVSKNQLLAFKIEPRHDGDYTHLRLVDLGSNEMQFRNLKEGTRPEGGEGFWIDAEGRWLKVPLQNKQFIYQAHWGMSDGGHYTCWLVDWKTASAKGITAGKCLGVSPDGKSIIAADSYWQGAYRRGGRRCGPIKLVNIKTGKSKALTSSLIGTAGGDWRKPLPKPKAN